MSVMPFVMKPKFRVVIDGTSLTLTTRAFECEAAFPATTESQLPESSLRIPMPLVVEPSGTVFETYKAK